MEYLKSPMKSEKDQGLFTRDRALEIIEEVRTGGDKALKELSLSLDHYEGELRISEDRISKTVNGMDEDLKKAINHSIKNVRKFHNRQKQFFDGGEWEIDTGIMAGIRFLPVRNAAVYIPGGRYPLPSSAIMGIVPAQEAGVERIAAISPPSGKDGINPVILGTIGLLGIKEIWQIGGAQAIAAMALGTESIKKVDLIVGPGNSFVTEAKRILFGTVGIDGLAGPSEVLIIADGSADPEKLAWDLLAQAEHDPMAKSTLICLDKSVSVKTMKKVKEILENLTTSGIAACSWRDNGSIIVASSLDEAVSLADEIAPEHLQIDTEDPVAFLGKCHAYGAAFVGKYTSVPFGDYIAGTNHTLPTDGRARFDGGLWTGSFMRPMTHLMLNKEGACSLAADGIRMAQTEGLVAHAESMQMRQGKKR